MAQGETASLEDETASDSAPKNQELSKTSNNPSHTTLGKKVRLTSKDEKQSAYSVGAARERRSLLKSWGATVVGTAVALALGTGIKDVRALATTTLSAGSIAFVVEALLKRE